MCEWNTCTQVKLHKPRPVSGRTHAPVDSCIAPLVQALNDAAIETRASCCGHGKMPGNIVLADGRELTVTATFAETRQLYDLMTWAGMARGIGE